MTASETRRLLEEVGRAMYGDQWQTALSRDLSVSDRTLRRWASGASPTPHSVQATLRGLAERRVALLSDIINHIPRPQ